MFLYAANVNITEIVKVKGYKTQQTKNLVTMVEVIGVIFGILGIGLQGTDIVLNIVHGIDD